MMRTSAYLLLLPLLAACGVARPVLDRDNTQVEVRVEREIVHDTAYVELPVLVEKVATLDTASFLENKYALSEASVAGGVLRHTLSTKAAQVPVRIEKEIVYRDSLVYRDRVQTVVREVEKPLTGWQKAKQKVGGFCFFALIIVLLYFIITHLLNLNYLHL